MATAHRILLQAMLLTSVAISGCSSSNLLTVITDPPGATVIVSDAGGVTVVEDAAPLTMRVRFSEANSHYTIRAIPNQGRAEEFVETLRDVDIDRYSTLPQLTSSNRQITVPLDEAEFRVDYEVQVTVEPTEGWVGFVNCVRSFFDTTEQSGAVPTRIVELEGSDTGISGLSLSPDGDRIVFATSGVDNENGELPAADGCGLGGAGIQSSDDGDRDMQVDIQNANLRGVRVTGGGIQHITTEDFIDMAPAFSSDGQFLVFSSNRRRPQSNDILRISADGRSGIADIYIDRRGERAVSPSVGADGTISFSLYPDDWMGPQDSQIWTVGGGNEFPTQVARGIHPRISPDGQRIAYIGIDGNVWVVGSDGREATQLTLGADTILERYKSQLAGEELALYEAREATGQLLKYYEPYSYPSWSSDSTHILYSSMEGNDPTGRPNNDIWIMTREGLNAQQLTTNGSVDRFPIMSPDHQYIYFISNRGLRWAIWRISAPSI